VSQLEDRCGSVVVSYCCLKPVAEVGGTSAVENRYQATTREDTAAWDELSVCSSELVQSVQISETDINTCSHVSVRVP
jgi:hypothetical protein